MVSFDDLIPQEKKLLPGVKETSTPEAIANFFGSGIVGAADAASFGFGDELRAGLSAWPAYLTNKDFSDLYAQNLEKDRQQIEAMRERNPAGFLTGQVAGSLATGAAALGTKGGAALANSLRSGKVLGYNLGLAGRAGKAGVLGAATGSASGFGAGEGAENRLESSLNSALAGGGAGVAIPVVGAVAGKVAKQFQKIPKAATSDEIKSLANAAYKKADETGGVLKGWFTNRFLDNIADIQPPSIAGKRVPTDPKLDEALNYVNSFKNTRLTLQDAQNLDEYLGEAIDGFTDSFGRVNKSGLKLLEVQSRFRNAIENADDALIEGGKEGFEALKEGRKLWSAQLKMRDIERVIQRAELTDNPATALKTGFRNLLTNAKKSKGYSKEELAAIEKAAKTGVVSDLLRTGGSRLVPIIAGASGGGVLGAAAAGAGAAASRGLATRNAMVNAENVARAVSNRVAPLPATNSGLPALISSPRSGQLAAPAGVVFGGQSEPAMPMRPTQTPPALDFNDLIPQQPMQQQQPLAPQSSLQERIKQAESGGNPNAQNPLSSASGLYQFTNDTWRSVVDKFGRRSGIRYSDKNNPQAQEQMVAALLQDNARILENKGIEPSDANLYFAHFMGAPAASKAISMLGKNSIAARSFPDAAKSNPEVFYQTDERGRVIRPLIPRTIDEVYQIITSKVV